MTPNVPEHAARILDPEDAADRATLDQLRARPDIDVVDNAGDQHRNLEQLTPAPGPELLTEPHRWAYYPWRRALVSVLGPRAYRLVRLDRNRNLITTEEQERLGALRIGVVGLSVGHAVAYSLAAAGLCGELRLADFDRLELTNLNRVPATLFDLGINKAVVTARRIAELDPYLPVRVQTDGITPDTVGGFLDGLDLVVEVCDSLDMKLVVREAARCRRIPVLMTTSDRGLLDVERFDVEPARPVLHGLLGDVDVSRMSGLSSREKVPYVLRFLDVANSSPRAGASVLEVGQTLSTWPQLATEVGLGATTVAEAVRRIGLGEPLPSGRVRVDVGAALDRLSDPRTAERRADETWPAPDDPADRDDVPGIVAEAAGRAPSGGNAQPWHIDADRDSVTVQLAPERSAAVDIGYRSSAVAVGAAVFNARVAAAANNVLGPVEWSTDAGDTPLRAVLRFADRTDPKLALRYAPMLARETNRRSGIQRAVDAETAAALRSAADDGGALLRLLTGTDELERAATIFAATDRIRYLTPELHAEMVSELRWPGDAAPDTGIEVRSLELDPGEVAALDILRRPDVMGYLARWQAGVALGENTRSRVVSSSALGILTVAGDTLLDYARGGSAAEAVWIEATRRGLAVHPMTPLFLYTRNDDERRELSEPFARELCSLQQAFDELTRVAPGEVPVIVFRFAHAAPASVRSRRRAVRTARPAAR